MRTHLASSPPPNNHSMSVFTDKISIVHIHHRHLSSNLDFILATTIDSKSCISRNPNFHSLKVANTSSHPPPIRQEVPAPDRIIRRLPCGYDEGYGTVQSSRYRTCTVLGLLLCDTTTFALRGESKIFRPLCITCSKSPRDYTPDVCEDEIRFN